MFCKGLSCGGHPCCNKITTIGSKYCSRHSRDYDECPICYDDMQNAITLGCGHKFCITCLQACKKSACPMCRKQTNFMTNIVIRTMSQCNRYANVANSLKRTEKERIQADVKFMNNIFYIHTIVFKDKSFLKEFERKLNYLLETELVIDEFPVFKKFKKKLESYKERVK